MKIPAYLEKALQDREKCAIKLMKASAIIDDFILKNGLEDDICTYDYCDGSEIFTSPTESADRVRRAIKNHKE